jgi:hypothetical protein
MYCFSLEKTAVLWIRIWIRKDLQHFSNLHPRQIKIRVRIRLKIYKLDPEPDPNPHQFADVKPKCMECEPTLALFQGFQPFLKLESGSGSASG